MAVRLLCAVYVCYSAASIITCAAPANERSNGCLLVIAMLQLEFDDHHGKPSYRLYV
jgi:hypothetical protein